MDEDERQGLATDVQGLARQHLERVIATAKKADNDILDAEADDNFVLGVHGVLERFIHNAETFLEPEESTTP